MIDDELRTIMEILPFLIPLFLLQIGLMVFALLDVVKRDRVAGGSKLVWILIIVLINIIGPIIYLVAGRKEDMRDSD